MLDAAILTVETYKDLYNTSEAAAKDKYPYTAEDLAGYARKSAVALVHLNSAIHHDHDKLLKRSIFKEYEGIGAFKQLNKGVRLVAELASDIDAHSKDMRVVAGANSYEIKPTVVPPAFIVIKNKIEELHMCENGKSHPKRACWKNYVTDCEAFYMEKAQAQA